MNDGCFLHDFDAKQQRAKKSNGFGEDFRVRCPNGISHFWPAAWAGRVECVGVCEQEGIVRQSLGCDLFIDSVRGEIELEARG